MRCDTPFRTVLSDDTLRLQARVVNQRDGAVVWANSYEGNLKVAELLRVEAEIAQKVATTLGQPYGVVFRADASQSIDDPPENWAAYACTLSYYAYRAGLDAKTGPKIRQCLEDAVQRFPNYATAWALLSQTYVDEIRFHYPIEPASTPASIERALEAAQKAVELDPENVRGLQALMFAHYFNHDIDWRWRLESGQLRSTRTTLNSWGSLAFASLCPATGIVAARSSTKREAAILGRSPTTKRRCPSAPTSSATTRKRHNGSRKQAPPATPTPHPSQPRPIMPPPMKGGRRWTERWRSRTTFRR